MSSAENTAESKPAFLRSSPLRTLLLAVAITAAQIALAALSGKGATWTERYMSLCTWDGGWYSDIVDRGYHISSPLTASNVAFFPAYPLLARTLAQVTNLSTPTALLVTSQLAALGFWWALLRILRRWQVGPTVTLAAVMLMFSHPGAFYFVVSYAESLFLLALVLFIACGRRARRSFLWMLVAAAAGYLMSATRVVGAPLAAIPALWAWQDFRALQTEARGIVARALRMWPHAFVAIATASGAISFFIFCAVRFGHWDQYVRSRAAGWGVVKTDYSATFQLEHLRIFVPRFADDFISPIDIGHLNVAFLILGLILIPLIDYLLRRRGHLTGIDERIVLYVAAWVLFFVGAAGSGLPQQSYVGYIRYSLPNSVLLVLALAHAHRHSRFRDAPLPLAVQVAIFLAAAICLGLQLQFCSRYTHGVMVG